MKDTIEVSRRNRVLKVFKRHLNEHSLGLPLVILGPFFAIYFRAAPYNIILFFLSPVLQQFPKLFSVRILPSSGLSGAVRLRVKLPIGYPETSVSNRCTPRNNPEDGRIQFNISGSQW
jgi:hypothetical protein